MVYKENKILFSKMRSIGFHLLLLVDMPKFLYDT